MKTLKLRAWRFGQAGLLSMTAFSAVAQDPGQLQRLLEQTQRPSAPASMRQADALPRTDASLEEVQRLDQVLVQGGPMASDMEGYWRDSLGRPVSAQALQDFWSWAQARLRVHGFVADVQLQVLASPAGGQKLLVDIVVPRVNRVSVVVPDPVLAERYRDMIRRRVLSGIQPGAALNLHALDQRLEIASHDVPLSLEAVLRPAGPAQMDVEIHVTHASPVPANGSRAWVQANNHGLHAYGRAQMVGGWSMPGVLPYSQASVTLQVSEGVRYVRGEHEALTSMWGGRWAVWGSRSDSRTATDGSTASAAVSDELGLGLTHLVWNRDDLLLQSRLEAVRRQASSHLIRSGVQLSDVQDSQLRWRWSLDNERLFRDALRLEAMAVWGYQHHNTGSAAAPGRFNRIELSGRQQGRLDRAGRWQWRWQARAQWAGSNLDSYHRMALGGPQGVRAYTSADGVGDRGALASFDVQHVLSPGQTVGLFYDAGRIKPWHDAPAKVLGDSYSLQAVGLSWSAQLGQASLQTTLAKGLGPYRKAQVGELTESAPRPVRLNVALNYSF